jgi:hypothetical protein
MTDHSQDDRLARELANLPPVQAGPDFTRRLLATAAERAVRTPRRARRVPLPAWLALATAAGFAGWIAVSQVPDRATPTGQEGVVAVQAEKSPDDPLEREYRSIAEELEHLRRLADEAAPVLYLTSTDEFDVVLDLRPLLDSQQGRAMAAADRGGETRPARRDG